MKNYYLTNRHDRQEAIRHKLKILHSNGNVGFMESTRNFHFVVAFPDWNGCGERKITYNNSTHLLKIVNEPFDTQEKEKNMNALYEMTKEDGSKAFAVKVAEKSKTLWVMEVKGTGEFMAVETSRLQEVLPYTVSVKFQDGKVTHYEIEEGKVVQGDILVLASGSIVTVCEVDTKVKGMNELKPKAKLVTVPI